MTKKHALGLAIVGSIVASTSHTEPIHLTHKIVEFIDGKSFGVGPDTIGLMLQVSHDTKKLREGKITKTGVQGTFALAWAIAGSKKYAIILNDAVADGSATVQEYITATAHFGKTYTLDKAHPTMSFDGGAFTLYALNKDHGQLEPVITCDKLTLAHLQHLPEWAYEKQTVSSMVAFEEVAKINNPDFMRASLELFKQSFNAKAYVYLESARGAKEQMLVLMEESCQKRDRMDSFILRWADAPEGCETVLSEKEIITFRHFDLFLSDLLNFLEDLTYSCPKAFGQFVAKYRAKKAPTPN